MDSHRLTLRATEPFRFVQTQQFIRDFYSRDDERVPAREQLVGQKLRRVIGLKGQAVLFEVEKTEQGLNLTLYAHPLTQEILDASLDRVRFYLGLDDDVSPLYERADPIFKEVTRKLYGYHMLKLLTPFEAACWALVQQRTPNGFAHKTMAKLCEHFGSRLVYRGKTYIAFPEARDMLANPQSRMLDATNNIRKTERLLKLTEAFATADEVFLRRAPRGDVAKWLGDIYGLGAWSVDFIMLRGLGRFEHVPWTDTGMLEAISRIYTGGFDVSRGVARELAERYGVYQGYWAHYVKTAAYGSAGRTDAKLAADEGVIPSGTS